MGASTTAIFRLPLLFRPEGLDNCAGALSTAAISPGGAVPL